MKNIAISNIINNITNNYKTIFYTGGINLFYYTIKESDKYNIINSINQPFSAIISDDPLQYSNHIESKSLQYHCNTIFLFHNNPPKILKKEDKIILNKKIINSYRVFFDNNIMSEWNLQQNNKNNIVLKYKIPNLPGDIPKTKDLAILNLNNNMNINNLYQYIKNSFPSADMLNLVQSYESIINQLSQYKIIICLDQAYDCLLCASLGSIILSSNIFNDAKISNIIPFSEYNNLNDQIKEILLQYENTLNNIKLSQEYIIKSYIGINSLYDDLNQIFIQASKRVYYYET